MEGVEHMVVLREGTDCTKITTVDQQIMVGEEDWTLSDIGTELEGHRHFRDSSVHNCASIR